MVNIKYQKGFEFILDEDINKNDLKELKQEISKFLINKGFDNAQISQIGTFNIKLEPIWEVCKDLI